MVERSETHHTLTYEVVTDDPENLFQYILNNHDLEDIRRIRLEVECGEPIRITDSIEDENVENKEKETSEDEIDIEDVNRFNEDSKPKIVADTLYEERGTFIRTEKIHELLPDDAGIDEERLSTILWSLADRDLIEKEPLETDKRRKVYRLSERGAKAVEKTES